MPPDFSSKTIDALAKRAAFRCSNPDCRALTVGPNEIPDKSTLVGEAAHIYGARTGGPRFQTEMSDTARAEITNGIWLCRNCHRKVDQDAKRYSSLLLFQWREQHEAFIADQLGSPGDKAAYEAESATLRQFAHYPPLVTRVVRDRAPGWEWRLTAELMRHLNSSHFRRLRDLREQLYSRPLKHVDSESVVNWVLENNSQMAAQIMPLSNVINRLNEAWGAPGEPADIDEIHHTCRLLADCLGQIVDLEEDIYFVRVPQDFERLTILQRGVLTSQIEQIADLPDDLDRMVSMIGEDHGGTVDNPHIITRTIEFSLPNGWANDMEREIKRASKRICRDASSLERKNQPGAGCWAAIVLIIVLIALLSL